MSTVPWLGSFQPQMLHDSEPLLENHPGSQLSHCFAPSFAWRVPAGHASHAEKPRAGMNLPFSQTMQVRAPCAG
eukprot:25580-Prymnesium_polylepis.4